MTVRAPMLADMSVVCSETGDDDGPPSDSPNRNIEEMLNR